MEEDEQGFRLDGAIHSVPIRARNDAIRLLDESILWIETHGIWKEREGRFEQTSPPWYLGEVNQSGDRAAGGCLNAFVRLADAAPDRILLFAKRWGVLTNGARQRYIEDDESEYGLKDAELSDEILNYYRSLGMVITREADPDDGSVDVPQMTCWWEKPISEWTEMAQQFRALLSLSRDLALEQPGESEDWSYALSFGTPYRFHWPDWISKLSRRRRVEVMRKIFGLEITRLLWQVEAKPLFLWLNDTPHITLTGSYDAQRMIMNTNDWREITFALDRPGYDIDREIVNTLHPAFTSNTLHAVLIFQLVAAVRGETPVERCSYCSYPFTFTRKPRKDKRACCDSDDCKRERKLKNNREAYRQRQRKQTALTT